MSLNYFQASRADVGEGSFPGQRAWLTAGLFTSSHITGLIAEKAGLVSATRSNWNAQSLPVRCHYPISCLLLLPLGANEFPLSSPVLPDGPQGAGWSGHTELQQQSMLVPGLAWGQCLFAEEEHAGCSGALLQGMGSCSAPAQCSQQRMVLS